MRHFIEFELNAKNWGEIKILRVVLRDGDPWGALAPLKGTPWAEVVRVVSGEAFAQGLHGYTLPLVQALGDFPKHQARKLPDAIAMCASRHDCAMASKECRPGFDVPYCYEPPGVVEDALKEAINTVVRAIKEGRYIVVVEGEEFVI